MWTSNDAIWCISWRLTWARLYHYWRLIISKFAMNIHSLRTKFFRTEIRFFWYSFTFTFRSHDFTYVFSIWCLTAQHIQSTKTSQTIDAVTDFGSGSSKSGIQTFFGNPAKSSSGQIYCWIYWMPVQLQYVQLIKDKTNATDLSSGILAILISVTHCRSTNIVKNWQTVT